MRQCNMYLERQIRGSRGCSAVAFSIPISIKCKTMTRRDRDRDRDGKNYYLTPTVEWLTQCLPTSIIPVEARNVVTRYRMEDDQQPRGKVSPRKLVFRLVE